MHRNPTARSQPRGDEADVQEQHDQAVLRTHIEEHRAKSGPWPGGRAARKTTRGALGVVLLAAIFLGGVLGLLFGLLYARDIVVPGTEALFVAGDAAVVVFWTLNGVALGIAVGAVASSLLRTSAAPRKPAPDRAVASAEDGAPDGEVRGAG